MKKHYHVVEFFPGCLNDADSGPIAAKADALAYIRASANEYRDADYSVRGNATDGYDVNISKESPYIGWRLVIESCTEDDCDTDEF